MSNEMDTVANRRWESRGSHYARMEPYGLKWFSMWTDEPGLRSCGIRADRGWDGESEAALSAGVDSSKYNLVLIEPYSIAYIVPSSEIGFELYYGSAVTARRDGKEYDYG